eukprot:9657648-Heterocapsa_arctica.AAC.1
MRKTQLKLNSMSKYQLLVNKGKENSGKGVQLLYKLEGIAGIQAIQTLEGMLDIMISKLNNEISQRWRNWIDNSWGHKKKDSYKCIRCKKGNGPVIVSNGGIAQMKDRMKLAEETWGGRWAVDAEDLP